MEWSVANMASLRQQVIASSPQLRALESQLQACALSKENRAAIAEKEAQRVVTKAKDKEYAELVKTLASQENLTAALKCAEQESRKLENQRVLEEQMADKAERRARAEAEKTVEMLAEVDQAKLMTKEREEEDRRRQEEQLLTQEVLARQNQLRRLRHQELQLIDQVEARACKEAEEREAYKQEMQRLREEATRLRCNHRELALVSSLQAQMEKQEEVRKARLEIEILERQEVAERQAKEKQQREEENRVNLRDGLQQQIRYQQQQAVEERERDEEYRKLVVKVAGEEERLETLGREARRRQQQNHRELADLLVEDRRDRREAAMAEQRQDTQAQARYHKLRSRIVEEEARHMLISRAPHLLHHLTPQLLDKLRKLS